MRSADARSGVAKGPNDLPHLFVIEDIDFDSVQNSYFYIECPFPTYRIRTQTEWLERRWVNGEQIVKEVHRGENDHWLHADEHYCTTKNLRLGPFPQIEHHVLWDFEGLQPCGKIELQHHVFSRGGCLYQELAAEEGAIDALLQRYISVNDRWPEDLPQKPGAYPVYFWSDYDRYHNDGTCGLSLDPLNAMWMNEY